MVELSSVGAFLPCGQRARYVLFVLLPAYAKAFFDLQLLFARRVTVLSGLPLTRALLEYTNLYVRFGLGRDFDPAHPTWRAYLAGLPDTDDGREWTYRFYQIGRAHV